MDLPGVSIADEGDTGMFSLRTIRGHRVRRVWQTWGDGQEDLLGYLEGGWGGMSSFLSVLHDHGSWLLCSPINRLGEGRLGRASCRRP